MSDSGREKTESHEWYSPPTDTQILDWLESNLGEYLLITPDDSNKDWNIHRRGHRIVSKGNTLREAVIYLLENS